MTDPRWPVSEDAVKQLIDRANVLLVAGAADRARVDEVIAGVARLSPRELVQFDARSRSWLSGLDHRRVPQLRRRRRDASLALWHVLGLLSADGHERERAIRSAPMSGLTARLLAIRCIDWVREVRDAALARLDECPHELLVAALPLVAQLAAERARGQLLDALLDARLSDDDLRQACAAGDVRTRRAAWQRLAARGAATARELREHAARDEDVGVRAVAAGALAGLPAGERRALARVLVQDPVGWVAVPALAALVELDGAAPILPALTARTAALRRAARDWAAVRDVDARAVYLACLGAAPQDAVALVALAEICDARDADLFVEMLADARSRVRAAGLRGLGRVDREAGRSAAIDAIEAGATGKVGRAAADVLRGGALTSSEAQVLSRVALDVSRPPARRFSALSLLRRARWLQLAVLLECHAQATDDGVRRRLRAEIDGWSGARTTRGPAEDLRRRIERLLPSVDAETRRWIEFVLRTST